MVAEWTKKRQKAVIRRKNGTFKEWKGGRDLKDMKKKENNFQGIKIHIGKEFKRQHGRTAKIGETVRTKNKDGTYNKNAQTYIKTPKGWRKKRDYKPKKKTTKTKRNK